MSSFVELAFETLDLFGKMFNYVCILEERNFLNSLGYICAASLTAKDGSNDVIFGGSDVRG